MGQSRISSYLSYLEDSISLLTEKKVKTYYTLRYESPYFQMIRMAISMESNEDFWNLINQVLFELWIGEEGILRDTDEVAERLGKIMFQDDHGMRLVIFLRLVPKISIADLEPVKA